MSAFIENVPVPDGYRLRDLQLEMSLKPFYDNSPGTREAVCREIFMQWQGLWRHAERVSILLWIGEGSEILEYDGNPETGFEWARYHGAPNRHRWELPDDSVSDDADHNAVGIDVAARDPERKGIHCRAYLYRDEPAEFTYGWLKGLVADLKRIGGEITGKPVLVGQGFDIGPEFAKSRFKFEWHREILGDGPIFKEQFISCEAVLHGDERRYAAYPEGIPEGLTIGEFLGRQVRALFDDCGQDFLWLSNGYGFALEPWAMVGKIFDGECFHPGKMDETRRRILDFWDSLRKSIGEEVNIRTRGTNLATGIDLGSDASPLEDIYRENRFVDAPVNSPWAALDGDFGLELSGWMSHMAVHPGETYRFRFYTHDPWWLNSPWLDRYGRQPHDLYLPLSVSRLQEDGSVEIPRDLAFLSIDDSHGQMPLQVPNEVTAFFLRAREHAPDAPGPLVWVYPFHEYHALAFEASMPERPFHADLFAGTLINAGIPLNSIADADVLHKALGETPTILAGRTFLAPVPRPGSRYEELVRELIEKGADVLLFGPLFDDSFLWEALGLDQAEPLAGDFEVVDAARHGSEPMVRHIGSLSGGGWSETVRDGGGSASDIRVRQGTGERVAFRGTTGSGGGRLGWLRASLTTGEFNPDNPQPIRGPILKPMRDARFAANGDLARIALRAFGWELDGEIAGGDSKPPYLTVHVSENACMLSGYHRNELCSQKVRMPLGAPLLHNRHNAVENGRTRIHGEIAWQSEVRVFVADGPDAVLQVRELVPVMHGVTRRILVSGLDGHSLLILPHPDHLDTLRLVKNPKFPYFIDEQLEANVSREKGFLVVHSPALQGELLVEW